MKKQNKLLSKSGIRNPVPIVQVLRFINAVNKKAYRCTVVIPVRSGTAKLQALLCMIKAKIKMAELFKLYGKRNAPKKDSQRVEY